MERLQARVCLCTQEYPPRVGGVGIAARRLAGNLAAAGAEVHVVTPVDTPGADSAIECTSENGCQVYRLVDDFRRPDAGFRWRQFVRYLDRDHGFDLFHGFFLTAAYPCLASVEHTKRPLIVSIRGNDALTLIENPYCRAPILAGLRRATWVTSINEAYLQRVREEVDLTGRCSVIRNGVQPVQENALRWKLADRIRGVVGTAGQFRRVKDIPLLIRAYCGLAAKLRRGLLLGGYFVDRDEESWCRTLIGESGLEDEVVLTGPFEQKAVFEWLRAMHVYVQPSAFEGLPNTLLEAACLGVPLVATAVGGMREILTDQEDALLVPHGDPGKLSAAIAKILGSSELSLRLSDGARRLSAKLSPELEFQEWLSLYRRLLSAGAGAS